MSTIPEHPMATKLYRKFKAGSAVMSKTEAYDLGSELDAQQARIRELEEQLENFDRDEQPAPRKLEVIFPGSREEPPDYGRPVPQQHEDD